MEKSDYIDLCGLEHEHSYERANAIYMALDMNKDMFCKLWRFSESAELNLFGSVESALEDYNKEAENSPTFKRFCPRFSGTLPAMLEENTLVRIAAALDTHAQYVRGDRVRKNNSIQRLLGEGGHTIYAERDNEEVCSYTVYIDGVAIASPYVLTEDEPLLVDILMMCRDSLKYNDSALSVLSAEEVESLYNILTLKD